MQKWVTMILAATVSIRSASAAARDKHCSDIPAMKRFQPSKFRGRWYDLAKTADPYADTLRCVMTQYKPLGSAGLRIVKKAVDDSNNEVSLEADAIFIDPSKCDGATVITEDDREGVYYTVVSTNYKEYAVVVACTLDHAPLNSGQKKLCCVIVKPFGEGKVGATPDYKTVGAPIAQCTRIGGPEKALLLRGTEECASVGDLD